MVIMKTLILVIFNILGIAILEKNNKARIDEIKLINQKMNAIIQAVPNNKELIRKVDEIHYFYQQWNEDEKNNRKGIYFGESSIGTK